jgi:hypothetical protein
MKRIISYAILVVTLSGCAGLNTALFVDTEKMRTKADLIKEFGEPDKVYPLRDGYKGYSYKSGADICTTLLDASDRVVDTECKEDPNYVNPVIAFIGAFGQAHKERTSRRVSCTSRSYGSTTYTDCD